MSRFGREKCEKSQVWRDMSRFAGTSKNCEKLEKSQFLVKLIKSSVRGGRRVSSKTCNFCDFSKNCENGKNCSFLLKLIKSRVTGGRRVSSKNCDFRNLISSRFSCSWSLRTKPFADFTKSVISPKSFRFTYHFGISLSAQLKHIYTQKPTQPIFK